MGGPCESHSVKHVMRNLLGRNVFSCDIYCIHWALMLQRIAKQQNFQRVEKPWNTDTLLNRFKFEIRRKYV